MAFLCKSTFLSLSKSVWYDIVMSDGPRIVFFGTWVTPEPSRYFEGISTYFWEFISCQGFGSARSVDSFGSIVSVLIVPD